MKSVPVRIDKDVADYVKSKSEGYNETFSGILRRLLEMHKLKPKTASSKKQKEIASKL